MSEMRINSPLRRWDVLAGLCQQLDAKRIAEIGCKEGRTTGFLLANLPHLRIIAVDPWKNIENGAESYSEWDWKKIERDFWHHVGEHKWRCKMLPMTSAEAIRQVDDGSLDLVFIDAAHDHANVVKDIRAWWPKVKEGGMVCGHDFQHTFPGVHRAVADCFNLLQVAVMPDSVWAVEKRETTVYRSAA
jgi:predicted O-methyltransferase YrrM